MVESFRESAEKVQVSSIFAMFTDLTMREFCARVFLEGDETGIKLFLSGTVHFTLTAVSEKCEMQMFHSLKLICFDNLGEHTGTKINTPPVPADELCKNISAKTGYD